jgi:peptidoglycan/LPS O-acetylase OafA/YrhL/lysophospholipase L1-like esterase
VPEPAAPGRRYVPGLDGLRAIAVLAVFAYHLGFGWASGGLLGVGVFFTLSGYLITDILLDHYDRTASLGLREFWWRRARRLLPALIAMLVVVIAWVTLLHRSELRALRGATVAALTYVSNWWLIAQHVSYFASFGPPSPLGHLWSLAVEEQFYLIWPWLLLLGLRPFGRKATGTAIRPRLALATIVLATASAVLMALLYHPGLDTTRVYDGTDTRAFGLLIGAALAMVWPGTQQPLAGQRAQRMIDWLGTAGLLGIGLLIWRTNEYSSFLYRGGLVLLSIATALVIAAVVRPASGLGRVLGWPVLRWLGARSYGIYLWHFPILALTTPSSDTGIQPVRATLQVAATIVLAALSWRYLEEPIRHGALTRLWAAVRARRWGALVRGWRLVAVVATVATLATACVGMGSSPPAPHNPLAAANIDVTRSLAPNPSTSSSGPSAPSTTPPSPASSQSSSPTVVAAPATTTSCRSVTHIGDSTSEGMMSADYLPNPAQRLDAQYARVGATTAHIEISGGTSILETAAAGQANAHQVAQQLVQTGDRGCWVLALGTNDTADVFVGSAQDRSTRIASMMSVLGSQPVMWLTVKSLRTSGPYSNTNMQLWNAALLQACAKYPNMRIYDWSSIVQTPWFSSDGIHYTSAGYAARARLIASALVTAFPAHPSDATGSSCVIR